MCCQSTVSMIVTDAMIENGIAVETIERRTSAPNGSSAMRATIAAIRTTFVP